MIVIDESMVAVETENELRDVLEKENQITTVYFANDITLTKGINVLGSKEQLTIDGLYPLDGTGKIHTYTDMNSASYTDTICLSTPSNINITVKKSERDRQKLLRDCLRSRKGLSDRRRGNV